MTTYQDVTQAINDGMDSDQVEAMIAGERAQLTDEQMDSLRQRLADRDSVHIKDACNRAYEQGLSDGAEAVRDEKATPETVERWFAASYVAPDEGLVSAMGSDKLAADWGVENGSEDWGKALDSYNEGYRAGARAQARE